MPHTMVDEKPAQQPGIFCNQLGTLLEVRYARGAWAYRVAPDLHDLQRETWHPYRGHYAVLNPQFQWTREGPNFSDVARQPEPRQARRAQARLTR